MIIALYLAYFGDHSMLPDGSEYVSMACWTTYRRVPNQSKKKGKQSNKFPAYSRGHIHITGPNLGDTIDFDVGYLKVRTSQRHIFDDGSLSAVI
jgi:alcohol oxidase